LARFIVKIRTILLNIAAYSGIPLLMLAALYFVNLRFLSSNVRLSPTDALFIEGVILLTIGLLFLIGRGGINRASLSAAIIAAEANAIYGTDTAGPNEILQRDAWKARGFTRTALVLILSGVLMILTYFLRP
jgi:hypothetical protein